MFQRLQGLIRPIPLLSGVPPDFKLASGRMHLVHSLQNHLSSNYYQVQLNGTAYLCSSSKHKYVAKQQVTQVRRVQMRLIVYARKELQEEITGVETAAENTGALGGMLPNKGGQVSMAVHTKFICSSYANTNTIINVTHKVAKIILRDTSLCFVNSHLAAHEGQQKCAQRCANVASIMKGARVGNTSVDLGCQFHHAFWFGDMNFRMDVVDDQGKAIKKKEAKIDQIRGLVKQGDWATLQSYDELLREIAQCRVLSDWQTCQCRFPPTFKVERNAAKEVYKANRTPSYTDRILFNSLRGFLCILIYLVKNYD